MLLLFFAVNFLRNCQKNTSLFSKPGKRNIFSFMTGDYFIISQKTFLRKLKIMYCGNTGLSHSVFVDIFKYRSRTTVFE